MSHYHYSKSVYEEFGAHNGYHLRELSQGEGDSQYQRPGLTGSKTTDQLMHQVTESLTHGIPFLSLYICFYNNYTFNLSHR